jgi:Abnormal spindle-like microcephaly-assoc'd, ASPM-SPD-2-Hydin
MKTFVINMVPRSLSGETNQDSEPNLAVDPANPLHIAATAFTPDPLSGPLAPVYVSTDGGHSWALNMLAPGGDSTSDITLHFGSASHVLYAGILRQDDLDLNILRTGNFTAPGPMTILEDRSNEDQPWVEAITAKSVPGAPDRIYVGNNNFNTTPKSATIDLSQDAATAPPPAGVAPQGICSRTPGSQNGPPTRPVAHPDGTIYAVYVDWHQAYFGNGNYTGDVVVCRDDNWGQGATPFTALIDPGDSKAGYRVAAGTTLPWQNLVNFIGQERGGNHVAIAVDPRDSSIVYVAWADYPGGNPPFTMHLIRSDTRGTSWTADLRTIDNCINPALAVDEKGRVGFLYQTLTQSGATWETHFEISHDGFAGAWSTHVLSTTPSNAPAQTFYPYLGDYVRLQTVGSTFYGVFCANNTPDHKNFPSGVVYQRNANFTTHTLLNVDDITPVPISIDPFFFKIAHEPGRLVTAIAASGVFKNTCRGLFADEILTLNNAGPGPLHITNITSSSPEFAVPGVLSYPMRIDSGESVDVVIRFQPDSFGATAATITVFSDDPAGPHKVPVSGGCPAPRLSLIAADHGSFGNVCVGSFRDEPIILNNSGQCVLAIRSITSSSAEFLVPETLSYPLTIAPGGSLPVPLRFQPASFGAKSGIITIISDDPASPAILNVSGDTPAGTLVVTGSTYFGGVNAGCCADRTLSICNVGDCVLQVTAVKFKRKSRHWKLLHNPFPAKLHPGSCLSVVIQYKAAEKCARACELIIESNDPATPVKFIDVLAYTVWQECGCSGECEDRGKDCCKKHRNRCQQGYDCCCDDDADDADCD